MENVKGDFGLIDHEDVQEILNMTSNSIDSLKYFKDKHPNHALSGLVSEIDNYKTTGLTILSGVLELPKLSMDMNRMAGKEP